ncbi:MAG: extracellular solute-binding protein, partial [Bauldia sp.]|nr:extracellular solute-binding protein [Bauldia sp.]
MRVPPGRGSDLTRRGALTLAGAAAFSAALAPFAWAAGKAGLHGLSIVGELKYAPDFKHFDYIDPNASKGGRINFQPPNRGYNQSFQTFNTLNSFVLKGDAPPRMEMTFDTLMTRASDEPDAIYGLVAATVDVSDDLSIYTFHLRPEVRFHDGTPLTADDVAFSFRLLKDRGHPSISEPLSPMVKVEALDAHTVAVTLSEEKNRDTILTIAGDLPIFSKAYYATHDFDSSSLDVPLGSGPYRAGRMAAGRFIEYERVADYWGKDLPVNAGFGNFDVIRIDFFSERQTAFEAFKKGEITFREEFTSITWAQDYNFPAVTQGKVKKTTEFESEKRPALQGFYINTRRVKFRDPRTRLAIDLAFDFEWSNQNLFFGS